MTGMGEKTRSTFSGATEKIKVDTSMEDVNKKISGVSEKLKGTVKGVPVKSNEFSNKIDSFLEERKDQIIKDWELSTNDDVFDLEKRYNKISTDVNKLNTSFNEYKKFVNKKFENIEARLDKLENVEE